MQNFEDPIEKEIIKKITEELKNQFRPLRLFLYGSRANGKARPDSDYDFVMVLPEFDDKKRLDFQFELSEKFAKSLGVEVQVWTYSLTAFNERKDDFSSIPETAINTGREIELG